MNYFILFLHILYYHLINLSSTNGNILFAANIEDFKNIAREIVPESLAGQLRELITHENFSSIELRANSKERDNGAFIDVTKIKLSDIVKKVKEKLKIELIRIKNQGFVSEPESKQKIYKVAKKPKPKSKEVSSQENKNLEAFVDVENGENKNEDSANEGEYSPKQNNYKNMTPKKGRQSEPKSMKHDSKKDVLSSKENSDHDNNEGKNEKKLDYMPFDEKPLGGKDSYEEYEIPNKDQDVFENEPIDTDKSNVKETKKKKDSFGDTSKENENKKTSSDLRMKDNNNKYGFSNYRKPADKFQKKNTYDTESNANSEPENFNNNYKQSLKNKHPSMEPKKTNQFYSDNNKNRLKSLSAQNFEHNNKNDNIESGNNNESNEQMVYEDENESEKKYSKTMEKISSERQEQSVENIELKDEKDIKYKDKGNVLSKQSYERYIFKKNNQKSSVSYHDNNIKQEGKNNNQNFGDESDVQDLPQNIHQSKDRIKHVSTKRDIRSKETQHFISRDSKLTTKYITNFKHVVENRNKNTPQRNKPNYEKEKYKQNDNNTPIKGKHFADNVAKKNKNQNINLNRQKKIQKFQQIDRNVDDDSAVELEEIRARTESLLYDYKDNSPSSKNRMHIGRIPKRPRKSHAMSNTMIPTRERYNISTPDYYHKLPKIAEKYNFNEPIPTKDQEEEHLQYIPRLPARINAKVKID